MHIIIISNRSGCVQVGFSFWASTGSLTKITILSKLTDSLDDTKMRFGHMSGVLPLFHSAHLSLRMVQSSPPRHASINMYRYLLSLNVRYNLNTDRKECPCCVVFHHRMFRFTVFCHYFDVTITGLDAYRTMKSECARLMMFFSERMCSCCLVSTMCRFFRIFMAYVFTSSFFSCTWTTNQNLVIACSTRINLYTGTCNNNPSATQSSLFAMHHYDLLWIYILLAGCLAPWQWFKYVTLDWIPQHAGTTDQWRLLHWGSYRLSRGQFFPVSRITAWLTV